MTCVGAGGARIDGFGSQSNGRKPRLVPWGALCAGLALLLAACAATPVLEPDAAPSGLAAPASGAAVGNAAAGGVTVEVIPGEWNYSPREIPSQVVPLRVRVINRRAEPILVNLTDAALLDDRVGRRAAMDPGDVVQLVAKAGEGGGAVGPTGIQPSIVIGHSIGIGGFAIQIGGGPAGGSVWGPGPGGLNDSALDPLHVGLRPGRLDPNTRVEGYLFFERPLKGSDRGRGFRLSWDFRPLTPIGAPPAPPLARIVIPLHAR
jgi:hypothetical protein